MTKRIKWTYEKVRVEALKYNSRWEFQLSDRKAYSAATRNKWLDKVCSHMLAKCKTWTFEETRDAATKYNTRLKFAVGSKNAYQAATHNGWLNKICGHMEEQLTTWTKELAHIEALKFSTRKNFQTENLNAYRAAMRNGWLNDICSHMEYQHKIWSISEIKSEALKFHTRSEFALSSKNAYQIAAKRNWLDSVCSHMERSCIKSDTIYIWRLPKIYYSGLPIYKIGVTSQKYGLMRIKRVAKVMGIENPELLIYKSTQDVHVLENKLLKLGVNPTYKNVDGHTELRAMNNEELNEALLIIQEAK